MKTLKKKMFFTDFKFFCFGNFLSIEKKFFFLIFLIRLVAFQQIQKFFSENVWKILQHAIFVLSRPKKKNFFHSQKNSRKFSRRRDIKT